MARTIPEPTEDEITVARVAMRFTVAQTALDWDDPEVQRLVDLVVASSAQRAAEIRWLRNMTHNPERLEAFLAQET